MGVWNSCAGMRINACDVPFLFTQGSTAPVRFIAYADMGCDTAPRGTTTAAQVTNEILLGGFNTFLLHFGDLCKCASPCAPRAALRRCVSVKAYVLRCSVLVLEAFALWRCVFLC